MNQRNTAYIIFAATILVAGISILLITQRNREHRVVELPPVATEHVQATATTSLSVEKDDWKIYENKELKIAFTYPVSENSNNGDWSIGSGATGKALQATIKLPSGAVIYAYATTKDYSAAKGGFSVSTEGFAVANGKYYAINRGNPIDTSFVPDEVWKLGVGDGSVVPVLFGNRYDPSLDYPDAAIKAMVNIPDNSTFTGVGFVLWNMDDAGSHPASYADLETFKRIVTSIEFR